MEFGDNEWFEKIKEVCTFPSDFAFYIGTDKTISATCLNTSARRIGNRKYKELNQWPDTALIEVMNCENADEYYQKTKELRERWL